MRTLAWARQLGQVVQGTFDRLQRYDATTRAAALAYYTLLSLFPLLILLVSLLSRWISRSQAVWFVMMLLQRVAPVVPAELGMALERVLAVRGPVNWVAAIALLWSASSLFAALVASVDRMWSGERSRPFWEHRLLSLGLVIAVLILSVLASLMAAVLSVLPRVLALLWPVPAAVVGWGWPFLSLGLMLATDVVLYALLYRFIPSREVPWAAAWAAALCGAVGWNLVNVGFGWYLARFARYGLVYGTLASLVAFLVWVYLSELVILLGAAFGAAWADSVEQRGENRHA